MIPTLYVIAYTLLIIGLLYLTVSCLELILCSKNKNKKPFIIDLIMSIIILCISAELINYFNLYP